jgi:hypothetical protein
MAKKHLNHVGHSKMHNIVDQHWGGPMSIRVVHMELRDLCMPVCMPIKVSLLARLTTKAYKFVSHGKLMVGLVKLSCLLCHYDV